jgi:16S rRNA (adenine1518-N6/adenine1519-N6)-dimethyltransferase
VQGSARSASPGSSGLGRRALRELATRYDIRPTKALGQHFLADPNLARRIAALAGAEPGARVLEIGAGLGSLTVALASAGAEVLAVELDRGLAPALAEVVAPFPNVRVEILDALRADWSSLLVGTGWTMASNLPYNVAVPIVMRMLEGAPQIESYVVMVQREVGERLAAGTGEDAYGAVSAKIAFFARAKLLRRVPPTVFWPEPTVGSVLVGLTPRPAPVAVDRAALFEVIEEGFAERRKTMSNALRRMGLDPAAAAEVLRSCGIEPKARAEELGLDAFAALATAVRATRREEP